MSEEIQGILLYFVGFLSLLSLKSIEPEYCQNYSVYDNSATGRELCLLFLQRKHVQ